MTFYSIKKKIIKIMVKFVPLSNHRVVLLRLCGYSIGKGTGIATGFSVFDRGDDKNNVVIGNNCSIAANLSIITTSSPKRSALSHIYGIKYEKVCIGNDVWIGTNVIILPGVNIGAYSIISAGTVVDNDVPEFSVASGNPMKVKKMNKIIIQKLLSYIGEND